MSEIKLKYDTVIKTLDSVKDALADVTIGAAGSNGKNKLDYTKNIMSVRRTSKPCSEITKKRYRKISRIQRIT